MKKRYNRSRKGWMRRTSRIYLHDLNISKVDALKNSIKNYCDAVNYTVVRIWSDTDKSKRFSSELLSKSFTDDIRKRFNVTARLSQCVAKQTKEMINSEHKLEKTKLPRLKKKIMQLDSRFVDIEEFEGSFDMCIKLKSGLPKIIIPFNKTKHYNKFIEDNWLLSKSLRIGYDKKGCFVDVIFEKPKPELRKDGELIGIDRGFLSILYTSDGQNIGSEMSDEIKERKKNIPKKSKKTKAKDKIVRKKNKGKFGIKKNNSNKGHNVMRAKQKFHHYIETETYRHVKQLKLDNIDTVVLENLKYVKHGKRGKFSRHVNWLLSFWTYTKVHKYLERLCEEQGISVKLKNPWKTSQHCSVCGNIDRRNRKGKKFVCLKCGFTDDADHNGSKNLELLGLAEVYSLGSLPNSFLGGTM